MALLEISSASPAEDRDEEMSAPGLGKTSSAISAARWPETAIVQAIATGILRLLLAVRDQLVERWIATQQEASRERMLRGSITYRSNS